MNVLDIGIILILLMFAIVGFKQGVIRELFAFVGIILIFYIAFLLSGVAGDILCVALPFFDFKGSIEGMSAINLLLYQALAFILIFAVLLSVYEIILKLSKTLQKIVNLTIILWLPSKLLGALVGVLKGYIILFLMLVVLIIPFGNSELYENSKFANEIVFSTPILSNSIGSITKSTKEVYALTNKVIHERITTKEANLETIDILLKHGIVDKNTIRELVRQGKLINVEGYDKVINKY
ncbi:MAG: CvpA family protein [Bacilli bacterium]|nr:CvpA family protein [Bacilli bacterium]